MFLTICTPTYNRAYTLSRTYRSLTRQTVKDFEWVIIDDGSTDKTKDLVDMWLEEGLLKITYFYQKNQGKHIALNQGVDLSKGELFTCLDSDDWFYDDTVEIIKNTWSHLDKKNELAGIIGLDTFENNQIVGSKFPEGLERGNWIDVMYKHQVKGDKAYFFVLDIIKKFDFPNFKDNRHMPPSYQLFLISREYKMCLINNPLKYVEYLEDGITNNMMKNYISSPDNYALYRLTVMDLIPSRSRKIINAIHYNSSLFMAKEEFSVKGLKNRMLVISTKPIGFLLYLYLKRKKPKVGS